jgi:trypsin
MVKLLSPIITLSSIAAASAGNLRSSKGRELVTQLFDTADVNTDPPAVENFKETRIIGGDDADKGEYGYTVSLEDDFGHFCGGTLIRPDIVMSAAHCGGGSMSVRVGAHDISRDEGKVIKVTKQIIHNQYDPDSTNYDFMLLKLAEPVPDGTPIARLHNRDDLQDNDSVYVIGWGNMNVNGFKPAKVLQHVEVKYIPNNECNRNQAYDGKITNAMLCAGEDNGGEDACQGDSGGPLVRKDGNDHTLVGVVSWGYGCASAQFPGVYSRITEVSGWINDQIQKYSDYDEVTPASPNPPPPPPPTPPSPTPPPPSSSGNPNWRSMLREDFKNGAYGEMTQGGVHVRTYLEARGKEGVIRMQEGKGLKSAFWSKTLNNNRSSSRNTRGTVTWKITQIYYGNGMEEYEDGFCVQYQEDNGQFKDAKCYESGKDFDNGEWIEDEILIEISDSTKTVRFRWMNEGNDRQDDMLFDSIQIEVEA